jgi:hypothetical protein
VYGNFLAPTDRPGRGNDRFCPIEKSETMLSRFATAGLG